MYTFSPADLSHLPEVFALIDRRTRWMQARGNPQWDTYREAYPDDYFRTVTEKGQLWLLRQDDRIAAMVTLWDTDSQWTDNAPALYLHNLAADEAFPGAGAALLRRCADRAETLHRDRLRLDCSAENPRLNAYYEAQGFAFVTALPGNAYYRPNLRQRML